jgi:hypothetical protein
VSVPKGGSGLLLLARLCRAARYRMSRTRQSLPPLYERESSSRLEFLAVSVLLSCGPLRRGVCVPGGLSAEAYLYLCNASSITLKLTRLCSCTPRSLSVFGSEVRNASSRS